MKQKPKINEQQLINDASLMHQHWEVVNTILECLVYMYQETDYQSAQRIINCVKLEAETIAKRNGVFVRL